MTIDLSDPTVAAAVIAGSVALFASVLTVASAAVTLTVTKRAKDQELTIGALEFLTGGTQKRAVGIALVEHLGKSRRQRAVLLAVLEAQRIYLSTKLGEPPQHGQDSDLEKHNLDRIEAVIESFRQREVNPASRPG